MEVKVGQVWQLPEGNALVMVSSEPKAGEVLIGKAEKRGSSYAIVESSRPINASALQRGTFIFDTEAA